QRINVEGRLLVGVRAPERRDDLGLPLGREDGLEPQLRHALLDAPLPRRGARPFAAEERPRPLRVERATLVGADPARTCREDRVADGIERLRWHEYDELAPLAAHVLS